MATEVEVSDQMRTWGSNRCLLGGTKVSVAGINPFDDDKKESLGCSINDTSGRTQCIPASKTTVRALQDNTVV